MSLYRAVQHCTPTQVFVLHCLTSCYQPGLDRGFVDIFQKLATNRKQQKTAENRQTHSGVYRVAPQLKIEIGGNEWNY